MSSKDKFLIRPPAVAGQFYPGGKLEAKKQLEALLAKAGFPDANWPRIIVVPHAAWAYSGQVAALAFGLLRNSDVNKVILLGTAHQALTTKIVIDDHDFWRTSLGEVPVEKALSASLVDREIIVFDRQVHRNDHVLEVELPFLQTVLDSFSLVPILIGQVEESALSALAQKLALALINNPRALLIVSSDLSHYPNQDTARRVDALTLASIASGVKEKFDQALLDLESRYPIVETFACGADAIRVGLLIANQIGLEKAKILGQADSGLVSGQNDQVVGYGSLAFWLRKAVDSRLSVFGLEEKNILLSWARKVLTEYLFSGKLLGDLAPGPAFKKKRAVFITLRKAGKLRGCLGGFENDKPVWRAIAETIIAAATRDPRFPPVSRGELGKITIEISILSSLKRVNSIKEIELGKHGVYLRQGDLTGTFLPQVASEDNWTRESFLGEICTQKMGLDQNCYLRPGTEIFVYRVVSFKEMKSSLQE